MAKYHGVSLKEKLTFLRYTFRPVPLFFAGCVLLTLLLHLTINKPSVENGETSQVIKNLQQSNTQCPQCPQAWHDAKFTTEYALLDAVYGKIFGGEAIDNLADKIPKWAEIKADELNSNFALKTTDVVLDLGCGPGFIAHAVKQIVNQGKVICFDVNRDMNEYARSKHGSALEYSLVNAAVDPTIVGKPLSSLPDNYLDVFYSFAVFIHHDMYMFTAYFEGLAQKMKLGGHVYLQYLASEHFNPNDPTFREHFHIWQNDPSFWTMAMHYNGRVGVLRLASMCGFEEIERKGHSGVLHPSMIGSDYRPATATDGNILFKKVKEVSVTSNGCT